MYASLQLEDETTLNVLIEQDIRANGDDPNEETILSYLLLWARQGKATHQSQGTLPMNFH